MKLNNIEDLIKHGESNTLEFKTSTAKIKSAFETICGYLNAKGGTVLIGVKNNKQIVGQHVTDQTRLEIANYISKIEPAVSIDVDYVPVSENKFVIKIAAKPNPSSIPYIFDGKPFWRVESSTKPMPQQRYHQLLMEKAHKIDSWELTKATKLGLDDLDHNEIINTIKESINRGRMKPHLATEDPQEALLRLKLLVDGHISNAAIVLFCNDPMPYYPQCLLRMAKFKGTDKSDLLDSRMVNGNAFTLLEEAENFLMRHMSIKSEFIPGKMARKDIPDYAPRAVREAVVNAICHRDYTIKGGSISFLIYSDRLEITSHGTLPLGIAIEDLKHTHESQPRNERITQVMYKRGIIESVGTGTEEMIKECRAIGKPDPTYLERGNTFVVCFKAKGIADIVEPRLLQKISERQKAILGMLLDTGPSSSTEIIKRLDLTIAERTLRRDLNQLLDLGLVKVKGKGPSTLWYLSASDT